jgi:hypothetical protein
VAVIAARDATASAVICHEESCLTAASTLADSVAVPIGAVSTVIWPLLDKLKVIPSVFPFRARRHVGPQF